jgi:sterol desaturase/sphingolipid hydroxylase (fatty acid hydroxylase superfamily)
MTPSKELMTKCLSEAFVSQLIINPIATYFAYSYFFRNGILLAMNAPLPAVHDLALIFLAGHMCNDIGFYWAHRIFHSKLLYATFHKQHHQFNGTVGIAAEYANPVEQILANMIPSLIGVILVGGHPFCLCLWLALRLKQTYEAHSGYCFRGTLYDKLGLSGCEQAIHHDYHHTVNTGNFGVEWMDWLFGTQDGFVAQGMFLGYINKKQQQ